jgi:hypothetical protein
VTRRPRRAVRGASYVAGVSTIQRPPRSRPATRAPRALVCIACGAESSSERARLEGWQISRDDRLLHCGPCAELHVVVLDDQVLYWPECGHVDDDVVLYDRPVCVICDD